MVSKITISLILILTGFVIFALYFETSLFFSQVSVQSIKIFYKTSYQQLTFPKPGQLQIFASGYPSPNWTVNNFDVTIDNAFSDSNIHFALNYENLTDFVEFFHPTGNDNFVLYPNEESEYMKNNTADMVITYPIMKNGTYYFYRDIIELPNGKYAKTVACSSFLKQTSFDTWEGEILLDNSIGTILRDDRYYASVTVQKLSLNVIIPNNYKIQNVEKINNMVPDSSGVKITKNLDAGEAFDLVVVDQNLQSTKSVAGIVSGLGIPGTIIAIFVSAFIERSKSKRRQHRRR